MVKVQTAQDTSVKVGYDCCLVSEQTVKFTFNSSWRHKLPNFLINWGVYKIRRKTFASWICQTAIISFQGASQNIGGPSAVGPTLSLLLRRQWGHFFLIQKRNAVHYGIWLSDRNSIQDSTNVLNKRKKHVLHQQIWTPNALLAWSLTFHTESDLPRNSLIQKPRCVSRWKFSNLKVEFLKWMDLVLLEFLCFLFPIEEIPGLIPVLYRSSPGAVSASSECSHSHLF